MRYSGVCPCGFETPLVDNEEDIDWGYLEAHQEWCKIAIKMEEEE